MWCFLTAYFLLHLSHPLIYSPSSTSIVSVNIINAEIDALPQQIQANLSLNSSLPIVSVEVQSESESDKKEGI